MLYFLPLLTVLGFFLIILGADDVTIVFYTFLAFLAALLVGIGGPGLVGRLRKIGPIELEVADSRVSEINDEIRKDIRTARAFINQARNDEYFFPNAPPRIQVEELRRLRRLQRTLDVWIRMFSFQARPQSLTPEDQARYCEALFMAAIAEIWLRNLESQIERPATALAVERFEDAISESTLRMELVYGFRDAVLALANIRRGEIEFLIGWANLLLYQIGGP